MNELSHNLDVDGLSAKFLSGNMSLEEQKEFKNWLNTSEENKKAFLKNKKVWEQTQLQLVSEKIAEDKINVLRKLHSHQTRILSRSRRQLLIYKLAAVVAIPLTFAISWYFLNTGSVQQPQLAQTICEVTAPKGHVAKCILPDGTEVWVNTGSSLTYDAGSFNGNLREVELTGEAYFEVAKNVEKPFTVKTEMANILVTGTSFNVKAYSGSDVFETILAEGGIDMEVNNTSSKQKISLVPGERAVYSEESNKIAIDKVEPEFFTSWRNGELLFKDATLNDLIVELERIYDIDFHLTDKKLGEFRFRGMFSYNNNLIEALEKVKRTAQIDYRIENKEVWLTKKE
ncbi:FecR domain-containing protein [Draconibacterium sp. IB214405]|uniref:FecR family protein n=1 Tax=Draconibacterium sp. IB214405 TaxID=3097352 RepID=UPI002A1853BD|nr:FecR domain-containing protein [Draconibacterium sp. IB214405]MDX8339402.1 FecR domain-containing protein [Draconibacterium sp. IB214405]